MPAPRIFMLEDDVNIAGFVRDLCADQDWTFLAVERVGETVGACQRFKPDLLLLDIVLPDGNGYDALVELRKDAAFARVPAIFLTGYGDVKSRITGFMAGGQDYVSKPFALQELLARMRAHLAIKQRADALARRAEELALHDRVRRDVADLVVHDLKDQLGSILITLELVRQSGLVADERYTAILRNAERTSEFMALMVNDLLDLNADRIRVEAAPLDLAALLSRLQGLFMPQVERRELRLRMPQAPAAEGITTDPTLVFRILSNLLSNAIKVSRTGQEVAVEARRTASGLRVEILDHGPGVPDQEKGKLFVKWHRGDTPAARTTRGYGIGLAFCRLATESLGGKIFVEDGPAGGSRFILEIPASPAGASVQRAAAR